LELFVTVNRILAIWPGEKVRKHWNWLSWRGKWILNVRGGKATADGTYLSIEGPFS
jgi:hypothetical protein